MILTASLPLPPSLNATYRARGIQKKDGRVTAQFYSSKKAKTWHEDARALLLAKGWRALPDGDYRLVITYRDFCLAFKGEPLSRRDLGAGEKLMRDTIADVLGVDDNCVVEEHAYKEAVRKRADQHVEIEVLIRSQG